MAELNSATLILSLFFIKAPGSDVAIDSPSNELKVDTKAHAAMDLSQIPGRTVTPMLSPMAMFESLSSRDVITACR